MIGHHRLHQTAIADFGHALRQGWRRRLIRRLRRRSTDLLSYGDLLDHHRVKGQRELGARIVPIDHIRGSLGRCGDFDRDFYPRQTFTSARWLSIARAHEQGVGLPLVELQKVGETYYVKDGHHRISVARSRGQVYIDAQVVEVDLQSQPGNASVPLQTKDERKRTQARRLRPVFAMLVNLFV